MLAWGTVIFLLSTDRFDGEHTASILLPILRALFPHATAGDLHVLHQLVRKVAHFAEYFVLGLLLHRALAGGWRPRSARAALLAVAVAALWASLDEASQTLTHGRVAALTDVALDVSGAITAQLLLALPLVRAAFPPRGVL